MGWKVSLVIIEDPAGTDADDRIMNALGIKDYEYTGEKKLYQCSYGVDGQINIGRYNGNIVIADGYYVTSAATGKQDEMLGSLCKLFPKKEILLVGCHSITNLHFYTLIQDGEKIRHKVVADGGDKEEYGPPMPEEEAIYRMGILQNGEWIWQDDDADPEEALTEDLLMEEFTFGVAKRRLGVNLELTEGEELLEQVPFRTYSFKTKIENAGANTIASTSGNSGSNIYRRVEVLMYILLIIAMCLMGIYFFME